MPELVKLVPAYIIQQNQAPAMRCITEESPTTDVKGSPTVLLLRLRLSLALQLLFLRHDIDADAHCVIAAADKDPLDRADVAVIAAPADGDVFVVGEHVVGSMSTQPISSPQ
jgi:hypothetical protein